MIAPGFNYEGERVLFIEAKGEDAGRYEGARRWRAALYYAPSFAITFLTDSELEYEVFLAARTPQCHPTYDEFKAAWNESHPN